MKAQKKSKTKVAVAKVADEEAGLRWLAGGMVLFLIIVFAIIDYKPKDTLHFGDRVYIEKDFFRSSVCSRFATVTYKYDDDKYGVDFNYASINPECDSNGMLVNEDDLRIISRK